MSRENLIQILDNISDLPTLPTVYIRVNRLLQSPNSNVNQIARIIESDQAISSKVLRLVNSSFFGFCRRVTQINQAVVLLGFNAIRNTVLSISVFESFRSSTSINFDRREFWRHSIATGLIARCLARLLGIEQQDEAFSGGILHDLGKLVLDQHLPEKFARILELALGQNIPMIEAERLILGTDHAEIGEYLMEKWNLPHILVEMVALHHTPSIIRSHPALVSLVHLGDILARKFGIGFGGDTVVPELDPYALEELNLKAIDLAGMYDDIEKELEQSDDVLSLVK